MIDIRPCTVTDVIQNSYLLAAYAKECKIKGMPEPSAQLETYLMLEQTGMFYVYGAFVDGLLIGYITVLISILPHYGAAVGITESFFVHKFHRHTDAGKLLRSRAEQCAAKHNAKGLLISAPVGGSLSKVLSRTPGYAHTNEVFFKSLHA